MADTVWLEHPDLPGQKIAVERESLRFYLPGRWVETDPEPVLTAADIEAAAEEPQPEVTVEETDESAADLTPELAESDPE